MKLRRRQELYLDGIETSFEMARICYPRLLHNIEQYCHLGGQNELSHDLRNHILLDVWSLIDTVNRLRILVSQIPGLKRNSQVVLFQKVTEDIEILRDFVQHLDGEIHNVEDTGFPIWGSLSWIYATPETPVIQIMLLIPGRLARSKGHPMVNPVGKRIEPPVDHISLSASDTTVDLSDTYRNVVQFEQRFEAAMKRAKVAQESASENDTIFQILLDE